MRQRLICALIALIVLSGLIGAAQAALRFAPLPSNEAVIVISRKFEFSDGLEPFEQLVRRQSATAVTFNSGGGSVSKAMELGRLIRRLQLNTVQVKEWNCVSACALAFLGGVQRSAEPGSIGVHKTSFPPDAMPADPVSAVQSVTAAMMSYVSEMGADHKLLQLALEYEARDMRHLSSREMKEFKVTNLEAATATTLVNTKVVTPLPPSLLPKLPTYNLLSLGHTLPSTTSTPVDFAPVKVRTIPMLYGEERTETPLPRARPCSEPPPAPRGSAAAFVVQVSVQRTEDDARASYQTLQQKYPCVLGGHKPIVRRGELVQSGTWYRVHVGSFATSEQATAFCNNLKDAGGQCIVQKN